MRSGGLTANDWAVVKDYIEILQPLKAATKRLEGRGNSSRFGAIYEVIPVFEYLLHKFKQRYKPYELVNFEATRAPEDHLAINVKAAWAKLNSYYQKLDESPVYYAACCLHPYYRQYCDRAWRDKPAIMEDPYSDDDEGFDEYQRCECERVFSEVGDLLTPRRRKISPQLLAALQCIRTWRGTGAAVAGAVSKSQLNDEQLDQLYELARWEQDDDGDT
ncbi:hypothetical protein CFE70_001337 [Pyrenophora teres f. teres 0-1]